MKQIILAFAAIFFSQSLLAQDVTYVQFDRNCMNQLEYRYSYPNLKGENAIWAYSIKPNLQEHFIFATKGAGHYSPERPKGTVSCQNLDLDDAFVGNINRGSQQMLIVFQRQSGGYWLMPVGSATSISRKGSKYWVNTLQSSFQFDTLRMVNEQNLAAAGSPTAAYFSGAKLNNCLTEFSFHCEPIKVGRIRSDFQFIPSIGFTNDRTGTTASKAMENELQLVKVNGLTIDDYIYDACPEGTGKIFMSKFQKPANYGDKDYESDKELTSIMQKEQDEESPAGYYTDGDGEPCPEDWEPGTHIVQQGENLRAIARTYEVSEKQLVKWNKIENPDQIEICQKIWLKQPPAKSISKGVKPQIYDAQSTFGKTVKKQTGLQGQKGVKKQQAQIKPKHRSKDPNTAIEYSIGPDGANDYEYFESDYDDDDPGHQIHIVRRGDNLYRIAKLYDCPEECIRMANGMSLEGEELLSIRQEIIIPDCNCTINGRLIKKPSTSGSVKNQKLTRPKPNRSSVLDETDSTSPAEYNYDDDRVFKDNDRYEAKALYDDDASRGKDAKLAVPLYKEHTVRYGETLKSIASQYKVPASKLAKINGLKPNEEPVPTKTFLIPIEEKDEEEEKPKVKKPSTSGYNPYNYDEEDESPVTYSSSSKKRKPAPTKKPGTTTKQRPGGSILEDDNSDGGYNPNRYLEDDQYNKETPTKAQSNSRKTKTPDKSLTTDTKSKQHTVKKGETVQKIADKYGVSPYEISQINNIGIDDALIPGKKIWIPVE
ncbi:MAG: LysM peptidoglycan-binding domain-containing protein [Saprospiraceae bacterium]